jgi:peroxiredoxin
VTTGDTAPDLTFLQPDGAPIRLSAFLDREFLLLVFLRHLA